MINRRRNTPTLQQSLAWRCGAFNHRRSSRPTGPRPRAHHLHSASRPPSCFRRGRLWQRARTACTRPRASRSSRPIPRAVCGPPLRSCSAVVGLVHRPDVAVVDIVTLPVVVLALCGVPTLFYCHFPDKLLASTLMRATPSPLRRAYRAAVDELEARALGAASAVAVNSRFTCAAFAAAFPRAEKPQVVHPCAAVSAGRAVCETDEDGHSSETPFVLSLNRFERKKNIRLAISALAALRDARMRLVVAGGWDERVRETSSTSMSSLRTHAHSALATACASNATYLQASALVSCTAPLLYCTLLQTSTLALYLLKPWRPPCEFANSIQKLVSDPALALQLGVKGRKRVVELFSRNRMAVEIEHILLNIR
eukprot:IDg14536t1